MRFSTTLFKDKPSLWVRLDTPIIQGGFIYMPQYKLSNKSKQNSISNQIFMFIGLVLPKTSKERECYLVRTSMNTMEKIPTSAQIFHVAKVKNTIINRFLYKHRIIKL